MNSPTFQLTINTSFWYSWFHIKGTWSVHLFNGGNLSIFKGRGSCRYFFHEIPCILRMVKNSPVSNSVLTKTEGSLYRQAERSPFIVVTRLKTLSKLCTRVQSQTKPYTSIFLYMSRVRFDNVQKLIFCEIFFYIIVVWQIYKYFWNKNARFFFI